MIECSVNLGGAQRKSNFSNLNKIDIKIINNLLDEGYQTGPILLPN